jgi:hypothetical protein
MQSDISVPLCVYVGCRYKVLVDGFEEAAWGRCVCNVHCIKLVFICLHVCVLTGTRCWWMV